MTFDLIHTSTGIQFPKPSAHKGNFLDLISNISKSSFFLLLLLVKVNC